MIIVVCFETRSALGDAPTPVLSVLPLDTWPVPFPPETFTPGTSFERLRLGEW
jgi:hypothetical protein